MSIILTLGTFDGVHRGHQALLTHARTLADDSGGASGGTSGGGVVVLMFDPHPAAVLHPNAVPPRLLPQAKKVRYLKACGANRVVVLEPTRELLSQSPADFIQRVVNEHHPTAIVEGADFRFGHQRRGDIGTLKKLGKRFGFDVHSIEKQEVTLHDQILATVSSSLIRWLVAQGRVEDVQRCLARPFELTATVVQGEKRGQTIGFPTANLDLNTLAQHIRPAPGVYAGLATTAAGQTHRAAISIGDKPTFAGRAFTIEAHLLDFTDDLYDQPLTLQFTRWLRDQVPFPSLDLLIEQVQRDIDTTRNLPRNLFSLV